MKNTDIQKLLALTMLHGVYAIIPNEALLLSCQKQGCTIYTSCIMIPPITIHQASYCSVLYAKYLTCLQALNAPLPMLQSHHPSPYAWSPYDICRFETATVVISLCPSLP